MSSPGIAEIKAASWDYLRADEARWSSLADIWENSFNEVRDQAKNPGGTEWTGPGAEAFQDRADSDAMKVRGPAEMLREAAKIAKRGYETQEAGKHQVLDAVDEAERDGFTVADDGTVTDPRNDYIYPEDYFARKEAANHHTEFIKWQMNNLVTSENDIANQLTTATTGLHEFSFGGEGEDGGAGAMGTPQHATLVDDVLRPGQSRNLGPVAGTGADPGIPVVHAADLGEVITLPDGRQVTILGDSFTGNAAYDGNHYPSVAMPVHFENGKMVIEGGPMTGSDGQNVLFVPPPQAGGTNTLPAGSIRMRDGTTYMMVAGTDKLNPTGGSWLTEVTNTPGQGWKPIDGSWRKWTPNAPPGPANDFAPGTASASQPTQISGYQAADGNVYIAADAFDRSQPVTMYRVDPDHVTDRGAWEPWTGSGWGTPGQVATAPVNEAGVPYGELSFRDIGGKPVLSGFNGGTGSVDLHVGDAPTNIFNGATTVVAPGGDWDHPAPGTYPQNYGGYILPGSTLDDMGILVSQWNTHTNTPYVVEQFQVNPNK